MDALGKKEKIFRTLKRGKTGYIPVIPSATSFALSRSPYGIGECRKDSKKYTQAIVDCRRKFGYDALWSGVFQGVTALMGSGLIDKHGHTSLSGDGTIQNSEDIRILKPFCVEDCKQLHFIRENIRNLKMEEPDEPIFTVMDNPSMVAAALMDGENYYYHMVMNPNFIHELTEIVFEPLKQCVEMLIEAGTDIIWLPLPTIGGTCISRKFYQEFCMPYNRRFNELILNKGAYLIMHTCGNWNDRFDLAATEGAHALHIAEADLKALKQDIGTTTALMGQIPSASTMVMGSAEEVYQAAIQECLKGAEGGGFILSPDCGMPGKTPDENVRALIRAARDAEIALAGNC